ncbi:MAG: beta-Ala-His dipeptidase [Gluconacetobacter diazotrophicus]|nr:beta-Ala-His dipeptidase [Gluconacetobacter diazotrophicus]
MDVLEGIEPREVMRFFAELSRRHRCSRHEADVADYLADFAERHELEHHRDALQNTIIKKPGTQGYERAPAVILHGHVDMVCKAGEGVSHDFAADGVTLVVDGNFIRADGTTLGADNGLGIAYMLALLDSDDIPHPPLECVMTAMEEMGKVGGDGVDLALLSGRRMIDFNWIDERQLLAGCSGDVSCRVDVDAEWAPPPAGSIPLLIDVRGGRGGHCEFDIHRERANAIVLLGRLLGRAMRSGAMGIATAAGGVQNNVIAAEAEATILVPAAAVAAVEDAVLSLAADLKREFQAADPDLRVGIRRADAVPDRAFSPPASVRLVATLALLPDGIQNQNLAIPGNWETSNNIGLMTTTDTGVRIVCTITSAVTSRKHAVLERVTALAELAGGGVSVERIGLDAPEFPPNPDSHMLDVARRSYERVMGRAPEILVSVCSLELGMFTQRLDGLDTIGIGTDLFDLHSPQERMDHTSAARVWPLIKDVMRHLDR